MPVGVERAITDPRAPAPDALAAQIAAALEEAAAKGLPVHTTLGDELVRYFIVTPPGNSARMQDLRAATAVRFQVLYGESAAAWHLVADWQADTPFLACAVPQRISAALQQAVAAQHACLVSVTPNFVAAWNQSRRKLGANVWLATLGEGALTLGLVADATRPRLAAVRTLMLPETVPPMTWLREQVARAALLDDLAAPSVLHIHGPQLNTWQDSAGSTGDATRLGRGGTMKRLHLDLAPFSLRREWYRLGPAPRAFALSALLLCVVAGFRAQKLLMRLDVLDGQLTRLEARADHARSATTVRTEPIDAKQAAAVNAAVARLNLPWNDILDAVEAATPSHIAVLSITPEPGRALIRIEAEASSGEGSSQDMIDYLEALEQQPLFARVDLVKHELAKDGMDSVIRFSIEAQWRETGA